MEIHTILGISNVDLMNAKYLFLYDYVSMSNRKINIRPTSVSV